MTKQKMSSTCKFKVGDFVTHIGGRGNTGKVTRVTTDTITVNFEDSSKDYNYNSDTRSLRLVKGKTVETIYNYPIYKQYKKSGLVIKFTGLRGGVVEVGDGKRRHVGEQLGLLTPHTDKTTWEDYAPNTKTKHICEVLEEKVNLETAIKFAKNCVERATRKEVYSDLARNTGDLMNSFYWAESEEGSAFWSKTKDSVKGIKATSTYSTFIKYAAMKLLEVEVEEIKEQEVEYPIYKKCKETGAIVKFIGPNEGIVAVEGWSGQELNSYSTSWAKCTNSYVWEDCDYKEFTYPIYKKSKTNGVVVKFTDLSCGFIIDRGNSLMDINDYNNSWKSHTTESQWEDYDFIEPKDEKFKKELKEQLSSTKKEPKTTKPIQTKTESTIMTKIKTTATTVATQNKDAIKVAAKLEAGKIINKQVIKQVKPHLPLLVRGLADHPAASIVLANVVSIAVKHFMPENKKLNTVAELMLGAAAVDTVSSFNIESFVEDLLKNIKLPTGALDDDN